MKTRRTFLQAALLAGAGATVGAFDPRIARAAQNAKVRVTLIRWPYT